MLRSMKSATAFAAILALSMISAGAANAGAGAAVRQACAADIQKFCASAAPGREAKRCLKSHLSEASQGCQSAVQEARAMRAQRKAAQSAGGPAPGATPPPQ
jgi:hypothetical protein